MKMLFVSLPMNGLTEDEIRRNMKECKLKAEQIIGEPLYLINTIINDNSPYETKNRGLWYLGKSLELMAIADVAYFADGWENARGCRVERAAAFGYGVKIIDGQSKYIDNGSYIQYF